MLLLGGGGLWQVEVFRTVEGQEPFFTWLDSLGFVEQSKVTAYVERVACGGSRKNVRALGGGLYEIKIHYAAGYRVYYGLLRHATMLLLGGGNKRTQSRDILRAKKYWRSVDV